MILKEIINLKLEMICQKLIVKMKISMLKIFERYRKVMQKLYKFQTKINHNLMKK